MYFGLEYRIEEHYKRLQEKAGTTTREGLQQQPDYGTYPRGDRLRINPSAPVMPSHSQSHNGPSSGSQSHGASRPSLEGVSRAEKLASVRAEHQKKHSERRGEWCSGVFTEIEL